MVLEFLGTTKCIDCIEYYCEPSRRRKNKCTKTIHLFGRRVLKDFLSVLDILIERTTRATDRANKTAVTEYYKKGCKMRTPTPELQNIHSEITLIPFKSTPDITRSTIIHIKKLSHNIQSSRKYINCM
jgi:hypothetical protein